MPSKASLDLVSQLAKPLRFSTGTQECAFQGKTCSTGYSHCLDSLHLRLSLLLAATMALTTGLAQLVAMDLAEELATQLDPLQSQHQHPTSLG